MRALFLLTLLFLGVTCAKGETLSGTVTGVADGDTLYLTDKQSGIHKIRLLGIDAPELGQAWGNASRLSLRKLVYRQPVQIEWRHRDQYGRLLGKIVLPGNRDANLLQLEAGMAWWNRKYAYEQTNADAIRYREAEFVARKKRLGLWSQKSPVTPWHWRYANPREVDKVKP
ncbi:MAG: thermonuclease family protein [Hydrogenophilaceae bacterium]|nr:thermonuclease family protein [Hydrogenophilaceae bacterium]